MQDQLLDDGQRENWGSRAGFVLAAIGSAVGLGNLWGFPYKVYSHGGGAFLIPYLIAMALIGIPLLILELSLGHMTQRAAPSAYRGVSRRTEPIGWWGILLGFVIITFYPVLLAYCADFFVECIKGIFGGGGGELPWAGKGAEGVEKAKDYFNYKYLNQWTKPELKAGAKPWSFGGFVPMVVLCLGVIWALMYLCIFKGVRMVSKVVLFTVPLPWIMLLILTVRGLTLEGAGQGLKFYLEPTWSELAKPETWGWAFGQMFFSMSLAFGVMVTYASFLRRKSDLNNNAMIIGLADAGTSFIAGIAVFATLGAMAFATQQAGDPVAVNAIVDKGPGLSFVAFPYALAQLPYSAWFGAVFFLALLTLGIDSAFSITESILASIIDKTGWSRKWTLIGMTVVGFLSGLVYCTRGGLSWLGAMDDFINSAWGGIALLGMLQCVVLGWMYRLGRLREHANERSDWKLGVWWEWIIRYVAPIVLSALFAWSLLDKVSRTSGFLFEKDTGDLILPMFVGLLVAVMVPVLSIVLSLIRSGGADTHAQHVGQPRMGRAVGVLGCLLVVAALAGVAWSFGPTRRLKIADTEHTGITSAMPFHDVGGFEVPQATVVLAGCLAASILATLIGSSVVTRAERTHRRPSAWSRFAAGLGVLSVGASVGVLASVALVLHKFKPAKTVTGGEPSIVSYLMLGGMLAILVVGLGWCFYRALRPAGNKAPPQVAEGLDEG